MFGCAATLLCGVHVSYAETGLRERVKSAGGIWRARQQLWELDWKTVRVLGLQARVVDDGLGQTHMPLDILAHIEIYADAGLSIPAYRFSLGSMLSISCQTAHPMVPTGDKTEFGASIPDPGTSVLCVPQGEFMTPLPLEREHVRTVPRIGGCYFIYAGDQPYYAGMSKTDMRKRIWAHATGRGSRMIRQMIANGHRMYFEYCPVDPSSTSASPRDISRTEFVFLLLHTGEPLPGNLKIDGMSLFPDAPVPKVPSLAIDPAKAADPVPSNPSSSGREEA